MDDHANTPLTIFAAMAALASGGVLWRLFQKHTAGLPLLTYEPRRPVPWSFVAPLLMLGPTALMIVGNAMAHPDAREPALNLSAYERQVWLSAGASLFLTATCFILLAAVFNATAGDLGLPASWRQLRSDVKLGAIACIAALLPIYSLMIVLTKLMDPKQGHPLLEQFIRSPSTSMLAAAAIAALVAAPLSEEASFRLVFQGWLERFDSSRARSLAPPSVNPAAEEEVLAVPLDGLAENADMPGWRPILLSSLLFGVAHFGQGVAPIPLIALGLVLGYLYQRTHRIAPCITCHLLFNATSLVAAWLQYG